MVELKFLNSSLEAISDVSQAVEKPLKKLKLTHKFFEPRSYQKKVFEVALRQNTIAVLETGAGKTMIAIMLINEMSKNLGVSFDGRRLILFLAPTVHLVVQQGEVIKNQTDLEVGIYYGSMGAENKAGIYWQKQVATHQVMVMTPQVLLDALTNGFLTLDTVRLMIYDECHHATGKHPYSRIMKEFYHKSLRKPHVFGMTASPVIRKGVSSAIDCESQLSQLESVLSSKIYTMADRLEMGIFIHEATEVTRFHDPASSMYESVKAKLRLLWAKFSASLSRLGDKCPPTTSLEDQYRYANDIIKAPEKRLTSCHTKVCLCLDKLGLICANEAVKICMEAIPYSTEKHDFVVHYESFLKEVSHTVEGRLVAGYEKLLKTENGCREAVDLGHISPKLYELMQVFKSFGSSNAVRCIIFVDRIITANVLVQFTKHIGYLSHFTVSYLTGGGSSKDALTPKMQKETLNLFRSGKVNLLFATNVAEEGLDIPDCSYVIRFDLPKTVRSYIQSRGRARKTDSHYFNMLERGNIQQREMLFDTISSMHSMMDTASNRIPDTAISTVFCAKNLNSYIVESTGAMITADSGIDVIYEYCETLHRDKSVTPKPFFEFTYYGGFYGCTLTLPPNAAFQSLAGPANPNAHVAKKLLCLDACKRLHQLGALDDHLRPSIEEHMEIEMAEKNEVSASCRVSSN